MQNWYKCPRGTQIQLCYPKLCNATVSFIKTPTKCPFNMQNQSQAESEHSGFYLTSWIVTRISSKAQKGRQHLCFPSHLLNYRWSLDRGRMLREEKHNMQRSRWGGTLSGCNGIQTCHRGSESQIIAGRSGKRRWKETKRGEEVGGGKKQWKKVRKMKKYKK